MRFRGSRCQEILTFQSPDPRSPILHAENQRSRSLLTLAAAIKSRNRISRFRGSRCQVNWTFQNLDSRNSDKELNQWFRST
jgi:hypothetical protein